MNELALFAGAGGGILGGKLLGWRTVCAVERDAYAAQVLAQRQNDGALKPFPIWSDVCTFDGRPWAGIVDVVSGGFPCQDISSAGAGAGLSGARSGLWREMARIIGEVRPSYVLVENSPVLTSRGLGVVLGDLASMGFDAQWGVVSAAEAGAPHLRERIWIVANAHSGRRCGKEGRQVEQQGRAQAVSASEDAAHTASASREQSPDKTNASAGCGESRDAVGGSSWWLVEPGVGRVADGVAARMDRLKAIGNGQVPRVVQLAWGLLSK
jgi:DNA (cytosine-5)-methyltransferase 1